MHAKLLILLILIIQTPSLLADPLIFSRYIFPPYATKDGTGAGDKTVDLIMERAGLEIKVKFAPWARQLIEVKEGRVALANFGINPGTREQFPHLDFLTDNHVTITQVICSLNTLDAVPTKEQLIGKRVAIVRSVPITPFEYILEKDSGVKVNKVDGYLNGLQMVKLKRVDYFIGYLGPVTSIINSNTSLQHIKYKKALEFEGYHLVVVKTHPGSEELAKKLRKVIKELEDEGSIDIKTGNIKDFDFASWKGDSNS